MAFPQIDGSPTIVLASDHGDGTLDCGFHYRVLPVPVGSQPPTELQNQVDLSRSPAGQANLTLSISEGF